MYYLLLQDLDDRSSLIARMKEQGILCVFHYVPLHSAENSRLKIRSAGTLENTERLSDQLVRLPLWIGLHPMLGGLIDSLLTALTSTNTP